MTGPSQMVPASSPGGSPFPRRRTAQLPTPPAQDPRFPTRRGKGPAPFEDDRTPCAEGPASFATTRMNFAARPVPAAESPAPLADHPSETGDTLFSLAGAPESPRTRAAPPASHNGLSASATAAPPCAPSGGTESPPRGWPMTSP